MDDTTKEVTRHRCIPLISPGLQPPGKLHNFRYPPDLARAPFLTIYHRIGGRKGCCAARRRIRSYGTHSHLPFETILSPLASHNSYAGALSVFLHVTRIEVCTSRLRSSTSRTILPKPICRTILHRKTGAIAPEKARQAPGFSGYLFLFLGVKEHSSWRE